MILTTRALRRGRLMAAVPGEGDRVTYFFSQDTPENAITNVAGCDVERINPLTGGGLVVDGVATRTDGAVPIPVSGDLEFADLLMPQLDVFEGLNAAMVFRNAERIDLVVDWLRYHADQHDLQAALIIDRARERDTDLEQALLAADIPGLKRVAILRADMPLGREEQGDERHPIYSPDAPGRDNMEPPPVDPWVSPFGERGLFDLIRLVWLCRARGVINVDLSDLIAPSTPSVFERALTSPTGQVQLVGQRQFPWSLDDEETIHFADHVCRRFDGTLSNPRWCIAPAVVGEDAKWKLVRVVGSLEGQHLHQVYHRCSAVRHPTVQINRMVPKSTLVEDSQFADLATGYFGRTAKRPPSTEDISANLRTGRRTVVVTCMKDEGPFILEWIAYHRMLGVEKFIVYTNDCTDGTTELLDLLAKKGIVEHYDNPFREEPYASADMKPQYAAFFAAADLDTVKEADWLIALDCDEFINIHIGDGRLNDLFDAVPDANMISMTWRLMGNSDVSEYRDVPIISQFDRGAPDFIRNPHHAWGFKTLYMNAGIFKKMGVHRPNGLHPQLVDELNWVNGSGKRMPLNQYRTAWRSTSNTYGYDLVTLNHYACRSAESFLVKRHRGRVNHVDRDQGMNYWFRMNHNPIHDDSIMRMIPDLQAEIDALKEDPAIAAQHDACVAAHKAKIEELMTSERYQEFYKEITSPRMRALSHKLKHFGRSVFGVGPQVLPDDVLVRCEDPEFYFTLGQNKVEN